MLQLKYDEQGLIPVIVQDWRSREVLMQAWANQESLQRTLKTGGACFYSRSRNQLWVKGETSGNSQVVKEIRYDCDADCLLFLVEQRGNACHTGQRSCFHNVLPDSPVMADNPDERQELDGTLSVLYKLLIERKRLLPDHSYSAGLFKQGIDRILRKIGEEASEVIIAGKNRSVGEVIYEVADLCFHTLLLLAYLDINPSEVAGELQRRNRQE